MLEEKIKKLTLIKAERDVNKNRVYKRLDNGQFVSKKNIEILQGYSEMISFNLKEGWGYVNDAAPSKANAMLIRRFILKKIHIASYCHITEKIKV